MVNNHDDHGAFAQDQLQRQAAAAAELEDQAESWKARFQGAQVIRSASSLAPPCSLHTVR